MHGPSNIKDCLTALPKLFFTIFRGNFPKIINVYLHDYECLDVSVFIKDILNDIIKIAIVIFYY